MNEAPLDSAQLARALQPFGQSTMLPAGAYTDRGVHAWEARHAFASGWVCLGRCDELVAGDATQHAVTVGDVPVLLTREQGELRAFANTCRHRGHELLPDGCTSTARAISCPYHAWRYRLDGGLVSAPRMAAIASFDPDEHRLVPVPLANWHGFAMVNATGDAPSLTEYIGGLDQLVAPYQPAALHTGGRHSYRLRANWKIAVENYHECYHCPHIHPELCTVTIADSGDNHERNGAWVGGSMRLRDGMATMSLDGRSFGSPIAGADPATVLYVGLFPNLLLSLHPDYVMTHRLVSLSPSDTFIDCSWLFPADAIARDGFDPSYAIDFWDITNRQDWAACESVQRGVTSPHFRPGPLAPGEDAVHQWVTMVGRCYRGQPVHTT